MTYSKSLNKYNKLLVFCISIYSSSCFAKNAKLDTALNLISSDISNIHTYRNLLNWPALKFNADMKNIILESDLDAKLFSLYSIAAIRAGKYNIEIHGKIQELIELRESWIHRLEAARLRVKALEIIELKYQLNPLHDEDFERLLKLSKDRLNQFEGFFNELELHIFSLNNMNEFSHSSQRLFFTLAQFHSSSPSGEPAFRAAQAVLKSTPTPAETYFNDIKTQTAIRIYDMQMQLNLLREDARREVRRLKPLKDFQQALQIATFIVRTYQALEKFGAFDIQESSEEMRLSKFQNNIDSIENADNKALISSDSDQLNHQLLPPVASSDANELSEEDLQSANLVPKDFFDRENSNLSQKNIYPEDTYDSEDLYLVQPSETILPQFEDDPILSLQDIYDNPLDSSDNHNRYRANPVPNPVIVWGTGNFSKGEAGLALGCEMARYLGWFDCYQSISDEILNKE